LIPYSKQSISKDDIEAVIQVLKSDYLTTGPKVEEFEEDCRNYFNSKYCISLNSATSALHVACLSMDITKGDIVWTSPNSFVASASCALYCGATIDFVDIDKSNFNISANSLEQKLIKAKNNNKLPRLLIVVHMAGLPCDMAKIRKLSKTYNFKVIEDASHAVGAKYKNSIIGDSRYSDITIFSFHPVKIFTTGEGGMILTNNARYAKRSSLFRAHGITRDVKEFHGKNFLPWVYEQQELGFNYRMTDIAAALGISQLKKVEMWNKQRNSLAQKYIKLFSHDNELDIKFQQYDRSKFSSSYHLFIILVEKRDKIFELLRKKGIGVNVHYIPIHYQPFYKNLGFKHGDFPNAEAYYKKAISLPLYPALSKKDHIFVIDTLKESIKSFL